jgi:predicted aspartyl protease
MPSLTVNLQPIGPIVRLAVLVSAPRRAALKSARMAVPSPVFIRGLIDTGASGTCVDPDVIRSLGIRPTGAVPIITPSTGNMPHVCMQYDVAIAFELSGGEFKIIETLPVIESELSHQGFDALIGRDILSHGLLFYNGENDAVTISF